MIYINGRFLGKEISGVPLFAREIVKRIDKEEYKDRFTILIDKSIKCDIVFKYIKLLKIGSLKGNLWEQISLYKFMKHHKNDKLLNLCNSSPVFLSSYITIHDIGLIKNKGYKSKIFTLWYKYMFKKTIKRAKKIFTDSNFSKKEIVDYYKIKEDKVIPVYIGSEHIQNYEDNIELIKNLNLKNRKYFISVASNLPHKNLDKLVDYARIHSDFDLILVSNNNFKYLPKNITLLTNVSTKDLATLYRYAHAFILISSYEGFGIPPMEAISAGCKRIILSNIPVFKEIYGSIPTYIDLDNIIIPENLNIVTELLKNKLIQKFSLNITCKELFSNII